MWSGPWSTLRWRENNVGKGAVTRPISIVIALTPTHIIGKTNVNFKKMFSLRF